MSYIYQIRQVPSVKEVKRPSDVPSGQHFAVCVYDKESVTIPGDERSRTNPGHGYPESTEVYETFKHYVTHSKTDWVKLIEILADDEDYKDKFVAFEVSKTAKVTKKVVVE
jgi:hypothetical protein